MIQILATTLAGKLTPNSPAAREAPDAGTISSNTWIKKHKIWTMCIFFVYDHIMSLTVKYVQ